MFEHSETTQTLRHPDRLHSRDVRRSRIATPAEELTNHFRTHYPILVDGVLPRGSDQGHFLRQARESLVRGRVDPAALPAALLREVLDTVKAKAKPATKAGITTVGPRRARVWWDGAILDQATDVLAGLDKPQLVLRFYDITGLDPRAGQWNDSFDIDVSFTDKGASTDFWAADRTYVVELGLVHADGRFLRLARTNTTTLPRETAGNADYQTALSRLVPRTRRFHLHIVPDQAARQWVESRIDNPYRDVEAESVIHMLYRAFLLEGPRALHNAPKLACRDAALLQEEYVQRGRRKAQIQVPAGQAPALLVARLDHVAEAKQVYIHYPVTPAAIATMPIPAQSILLQAFARLEQPSLPEPVAAMSNLVRQADSAEQVVATLAEPVFKAAATLRQQLSRLEPSRERRHALRKPVARIDRFGPDEAKHFAKAGVRIDKMALTLEGRMRPGTRLKVAGKIVRADANGRFRLDCVVSGGNAHSLIKSEWKNKPVHAKA